MTTATAARGANRVGLAMWSWSRWGLPAILLLYLLIGLTWWSVVPLGEGPDEPAHFAYALYLRREGRLPVVIEQPRSTNVSAEAHQPPLAYLLMQPFIVEGQQLPKLHDNSNFLWSGGEEPNAFLHGVQEKPPYRGVILSWRLARLVSLCLGALSLLLCYATLRQLWSHAPALTLGGTALVAFNPQWVFHHTLVSNDPLLISLTSLLIYASVAAAQQRSAQASVWRLPLLCGTALGLMLVTKQSSVVFLPVPLLGLWLARADLRRWLAQAGVVLVVALLLSGWWYIRNWRLYGDPMGLQVFRSGFAGGDFRPDSLPLWQAGAWNLLRSSWGLFGWMTLPLAEGAYTIVRTVLLLATVGLLVSVGQGIWKGREHGGVVLLAAAGLALLWVVLFGLTARTVAWPGRFIFPAMPAFAGLLAVGLLYVLPQRTGLIVTVVTSLIAVALLPPGLLRPNYDSPALRADEVTRNGPYARFDWGWRRGLELHEAHFERTGQTGSTMTIRLTWHSVEVMDKPYTVFLHLVKDDEVVAASNELPAGGMLPTDDWVPGDWFRDEHQVSLAGVPPGTYRLRVGLYHPPTTERMRVYSATGELLGDFVDLGEVRIVR